ncbi:MAG: sulfatase-like hydrolase/transferase [Phycisphaeraceae bacterium]
MALVRNLVIVLAHGLRSDALSDDRSWPLYTPTLERLAQRGARLVATSASPADGAGTASLLTGLHARQHGFYGDGPIPPLAQALPRWLAEAGYHVAGVGCVGPVQRWLHEAVPVAPVDQLEPAGCAYWSAMGTRKLAGALQKQREQRLRSGPFEPHRLLLEPEDDIDGFIGREAAGMLKRMPGDMPWALLVMFSGPGNDLPPPTLYESVVEPAALQGGFVPADLRQLDALAEPAYPRALLQRLEPHTVGRIRADYLGRVSLLDFSLNRLMRGLRQRADGERTWTVVGSDRGHLLGEHGLIGPRSFLAGAVEVPVLVVPPEDGRGAARLVSEGLVSTVDVAATAVALGSCDRPAVMAGRSLLPALTGEGELPDPPGGNISEFGDRLMLETERFRAVYDRRTGQCMGLYDLLHDPDERANLVETPRGRNLVDALRWRVAEALMPLRAVTGVYAGC